MNAIFDSNIFIGALHARDEHSKKSIELLQKFNAGTIRKIIITNYVLLETVNFLLRKATPQVAREAHIFLTQTDRITIIHVDRLMSARINILFEKYSLSLTDCSLIALAELEKLQAIHSFDKDFDKVKEVKRLAS